MIAYLCLFSASLVLAEYCQFPTDHPIQDLELGDTVRVQILDSRRVYIYTDSFDDCRGCVRSIKFCYSAGIGADYVELMTIEIGNDPRESHRVIVNSTHDRANCGQRYSLGLSCPVLQCDAPQGSGDAREGRETGPASWLSSWRLFSHDRLLVNPNCLLDRFSLLPLFSMFSVFVFFPGILSTVLGHLSSLSSKRWRLLRASYSVGPMRTRGEQVTQ